MAYGLKYTQYLEKGGAQLQIRVYAKDWTGASYGMAHVTGASLQIIGGQSDVLTPYIKTAFSWSLADAWDQGATKADGTTCVNAANEKCGKWEEFYTPDATKFRVELWTKATPSATAVCIWKGYVTPDSWSENMIYRGSVTITARDMLGALQDKEFDLTGRVTVLDVIQGALAACECPMALDYTAAHFLVNENGTSILQHTFAASTFSGDNWQTVLQETLESLGLVLRYNGAGQLILTSLRYLSADTLSGSHGIEFISRSGLRELDPALKLITETFDVNFVAYNAPDPDASQFSRNGGTITCSLGQRSGKLYAYTLTRQDGEGWAGGLAIPLYGTIGPGVQSRGMFFPTNAVTTGTTDIPEADYINPRLQRSFRFAIKQDGPLVLASGSNVCDTFSAYNGAGYGIDQIGLRIEAVSSGGSTKYLNENGVWADEISYRYVSLDEEVEVPDFGVAQGETFYYRIVLKDVSTAAATDNMRGLAPLLAALLLEVSPNTNSTVATEYKTTTVYNEDNNVTITRRPKIGCAAGAVDGCIDFYENVLALGQAIVADHWNWPGESSYYPLSVMIQAQALCFHAAAASVFTGTLHDKATPEALAFPGCAYTYYERSCVPISGTFDFTSGFVAQTFIREVYSWEEVWGTFAPDYTQISGSGKGSTSATGSGGSSVSPGGGGGGGGGITARSYFEEDLEDPGRINLKEQYDELAIPDLLIGANNESLTADLDIIGASLQSLQAQLDAVASRDAFDELTATALFADIVSVGDRLALGDAILEWDAEHKAWHLIGNFYADGFVSAGGASTGGGASGVDLDAVWASLKNTTPDAHASDKISTAHIPDMASAYGYVKTADISDMATKTWVVQQGYLTDADLTVVGQALKSLQSQVDSVAARDMFDELKAASVFADTVAASAIYGALHGNADTATDADTLDGQHGSYYATAASVTTLQGYFTNGVANNADKLDGIHASGLFTAMSSSAATNLSITIGGTNKTATLYATYDSASENIADKFGIVSGALQSLQKQIDSVASRSDISDYEATTEAKLDYVCDMMRSLQSQIDSVASRTADVSANGYFDMLAVGGDINAGNVFSTGQVTGGVASDLRLKDRVKAMTVKEARRVVEEARPVTFVWNEKAKELGRLEGEDVGVIAQEVEAYLPQAVSPIWGEFKRVSYEKFIPALLKVCKEQERRIRELENKLK